MSTENLTTECREFAAYYRKRSVRCRNNKVADCLERAADEIHRLRMLSVNFIVTGKLPSEYEEE